MLRSGSPFAALVADASGPVAAGPVVVSSGEGQGRAAQNQ